jgi:hypothetical protein
MRAKGFTTASVLGCLLPVVVLAAWTAAECYVNDGALICCSAADASSEYDCNGNTAWDCVGTSSGAVQVIVSRHADSGEDGYQAQEDPFYTACTLTHRACGTKPNFCVETVENGSCTDQPVDTGSGSCIGQPAG